jgi:hypothetical protein
MVLLFEEHKLRMKFIGGKVTADGTHSQRRESLALAIAVETEMAFAFVDAFEDDSGRSA